MNQLRVIATGIRIRGTFDYIPGCAEVAGFTLNEKGELTAEYAGGTDVWWDD